MQPVIKTPRTKCFTCMRPSSSCVCNYIGTFQTKTRFVILMHPKEYKKERNGTGRMTQLQLKNSEIIVGVDFTHNIRVNELLSQENNSSFLLYPGEDNFNLSTRKSGETIFFMGGKPNVFILDGTWPCARKMLKLSTNLQHLKRVSFDNDITSKFIFKQQPEPLCLSTIESVFTVINLLNEAGLENCETKDFLLPFEKMIAYQVNYELNPNPNSYRPNKSRELIPRDRYKKSTQRTIFFNQ